MSEQKSVLMVCLGNICRSPIAAAVFRHVAKQKGVDAEWRCESAGLGGWHVGSPMDPRSAAVLRKNNIDSRHSARQVTSDDFREFDYVFGMDKENINGLKKKAPAGSKAKIELLGSHDPQGKVTIHDPYYDSDNSGFEECYQICSRACAAFLDKISK